MHCCWRRSSEEQHSISEKWNNHSMITSSLETCPGPIDWTRVYRSWVLKSCCFQAPISSSNSSESSLKSLARDLPHVETAWIRVKFSPMRLAGWHRDDLDIDHRWRWETWPSASDFLWRLPNVIPRVLGHQLNAPNPSSWVWVSALWENDVSRSFFYIWRVFLADIANTLVV